MPKSKLSVRQKESNDGFEKWWITDETGSCLSTHYSKKSAQKEARRMTRCLESKKNEKLDRID